MRTMKTNLSSLAKDYERIASAISYLESNVEDQPELEDIASHVGLSTSHFQRMFSRWAGISVIFFSAVIRSRFPFSRT